MVGVLVGFGIMTGALLLVVLLVVVSEGKEDRRRKSRPPVPPRHLGYREWAMWCEEAGKYYRRIGMTDIASEYDKMAKGYWSMRGEEERRERDFGSRD